MASTPEYNKAWRDDRKARGMCISCKRPAMAGKIRCEDCAEDNRNEQSAARTRALLARSTCAQ